VICFHNYLIDLYSAVIIVEINTDIAHLSHLPKIDGPPILWPYRCCKEPGTELRLSRRIGVRSVCIPRLQNFLLPWGESPERNRISVTSRNMLFSVLEQSNLSSRRSGLPFYPVDKE
jgi:hypothetical protein